MTVEYRALRPEDIEQSAYIETVAFYNEFSQERVELARKYFPPEWTVGAFVDGRLVADVRAIPGVRHINGAGMRFATVGPVACLVTHRRQGHVGRLLRMTLERLREQGTPLSGLYTPHDALYARYGWERAEGRKRYSFHAKDVTLRLRGARGTFETLGPDGWQTLNAVYERWAAPRNGPLLRVEPWWREAVMRFREMEREIPCEATLWRDASGEAQGYLVYAVKATPRETSYPHREVIVRDFVALTPDAYLGLWEHLLTHDLADKIVAIVQPEDPFPDLTGDPWRIHIDRAEGAMIRVVDVERAFGSRPYCGDGSVSFTLAVADSSAPWNNATWHIEAAEGRMRAEKADGPPDAALSANTLAPLFTGHLTPRVAAEVGLLTVRRPDAMDALAQAFAVTHPPFCSDNY